MSKKYSRSVTMTEKMLKHVQKKPDHMSRSCYIEEMFWKGVEHSENNSQVK